MSGIRIKVVAGKTVRDSRVDIRGSLQHVITDAEKVTFKAGDADLKRGVARLHGKEPNHAWLHSPTLWGDLYTIYAWAQVQTVLKPIKAEILGVDSKPTIIAKKNLKNESNKKATFTTSISEQVKNSVSNTWSQSNSVSFSQAIKYELGFLGTGVGGETSFGFEHQWGKNKTETRETTVGTQAGTSVELEPGEAVVVELSASSGRMQVRITYEAHLIGGTAVNYNDEYKGHHYYFFDIAKVLGGSNKVTITEDMEIGFYSDSNVTIKNAAGEKRPAIKHSPRR